ncbi:uncharacterized protein B0H64DRAFT_50904 [Chaetomium fimeti]|uniref:Uncharacterized protein n=1 Tax=Chaetomium fimeti TaxID=1854472 RepID=A0AAE0H6T6_9PEZI|nr:hypothetical protein B0H64DRAFT_50904 [Chaetomium fimeti]
MNVNHHASKANGRLSSGPGGAHTPVCGCCLAYQAVKARERVRQTLVTVQNHMATLGRSPVKSKFEEIILQLADVCIRYENAERLLVQTAESGDSNERKQAILGLVGTMIATAGKQLDLLIRTFAGTVAEQKSNNNKYLTVPYCFVCHSKGEAKLLC